jgi:hypothetical protein
MAHAPQPTNYVVVLAAESAARFQEEEEPMVVRDFPTPVGKVTLTFRTRFSDEGHEANVPREMWIDVRGEATCDLNEAINVYGGAGMGFLPAIALATNAAIEDAQPKLAYDNTAGHNPREFLESFVAERTGVPLPTRPVNVQATLALIIALVTHREGERLRRATEQYRLALSHWVRGHESLALMHLFMGMEAITTSAVRRTCTEAGLDEEGVARSRGIDVDGAPVKSVWRRELESEVRRRILFQGDMATLAKTKRASDGLEHGFLDFTAVHTLAEETRDRTASYLREAIIDFAGLEDEMRQQLLALPYSTPLKCWLVRYLRGRFIGDAADLAAPDQEYPIFHWRSKLKSLKRTETGGYEITPDETLIARFSEEVTFQQTSFEIWGPTGAQATESVPVVPERLDTAPNG